MDENYKIECYASGDISYLNDSFEVFFDSEESMLKLRDSLPESYTTKHYKKNNNGKWTRIYLT